MEKKNIKWGGIKYSAYTDRGKQVRRYKLQNKTEKTVKAISLCAVITLPVLSASSFA